MILLEKGLFDETLALKRGFLEPNMILIELAAWMGRVYGIEVINFSYKQEQQGSRKGLIILFEHIYESGFDSVMSRDLVNHFRDFCEMYDYEDYHRSDDIYVSYINFEDELRSEIMKMAWKDIENIGKAFTGVPIWKVHYEFDQVHIFYNLESEVEKYENDGISKHIEEHCHHLLGKYDEFGVYGEKTVCKFVSREMINDKFAGNMFYYSKR